MGERLGPAIGKDSVAETIAELLSVYLEQRAEGERFIETYRRIGVEPFRARVYNNGVRREAA